MPSASSRSPRSPKRSPRRAPALAARPKAVWLSLLASMTAVGGLLLALEGRPSPRVDGLSLSPLAAASEPSSIESIFRTRVPIEKGRWKSIVIHHSASPVGGPASIAAEHEKRGFKGLGHHFLIGNGSGMADGEVHLGFRWRDQLPGAHAAGRDGDWHNLNSVSICLVGDGNRRPFTRTQIEQLAKVVGALCRELDIPRERVVLHSEIARTDDPGLLFPSASFREELAARP